MSGIPAGAGQLLGKRLGKFEILALLALGGTAEIYLARIGGTAGFEKYVVVKCLHDHLADDAEFVKMFLDEARLPAHTRHSNNLPTLQPARHASIARTSSRPWSSASTRAATTWSWSSSPGCRWR